MPDNDLMLDLEAFDTLDEAEFYAVQDVLASPYYAGNGEA